MFRAFSVEANNVNKLEKVKEETNNITHGSSIFPALKKKDFMSLEDLDNILFNKNLMSRIDNINKKNSYKRSLSIGFIKESN